MNGRLPEKATIWSPIVLKKFIYLVRNTKRSIIYKNKPKQHLAPLWLALLIPFPPVAHLHHPSPRQLTGVDTHVWRHVFTDANASSWTGEWQSEMHGRSMGHPECASQSDFNIIDARMGKMHSQFDHNTSSMF